MGVEILLPVDSSSDTKVVTSDAMPADMMGLDIGPETAKIFAAALVGAKSVLWNGPAGVFENALYAEGTKKLCEAVASCTKAGATTVIGGGASLEYCEGKALPGMVPFEIK